MLFFLGLKSADLTSYLLEDIFIIVLPGMSRKLEQHCNVHQVSNIDAWYQNVRDWPEVGVATVSDYDTGVVNAFGQSMLDQSQATSASSSKQSLVVMSLDRTPVSGTLSRTWTSIFSFLWLLSNQFSLRFVGSEEGKCLHDGRNFVLLLVIIFPW